MQSNSQNTGALKVYTRRAVTETPNREPQEYGRNVKGIYGRYVPLIVLYSWRSLFRFLIAVLLNTTCMRS